jgi:Uma2 family endonuclease
MALSTGNKLMTAEDLLALGSDFHGELVRGRLVEMAPASWKHGQIGLRVGVLLGTFVQQNKLGIVVAAETGFILARDPDVVRAPDAAFISAARVAAADEHGFFTGPPDLAVEVLSPSDKVFDVDEKIADFLTAGCRAVWIINPKQESLTVYRPGQAPQVLRKTDSVDGGEVLPGFACPVADLFA